ncbi:exonuclease domain-containing protein [Xylocopilactobacillus apicola]|uniref:DNA polymerase III polC-type n=1 Tax=Xylocopilactobacillus apicola TaxID=2932184 RepID=A0AAU9D8J5_9LACO|nr:exonuclease domain-containing protein [Xylocopilactobacillus apicola]BDR57790.1 DNA polymerase III subunit epsilon [Xylocopilactobacillus apicola]
MHNQQVRQKGRSCLEFAENYTLIDLETTGMVPNRDRIIEVGGLKVKNNEVISEFSSLVKYPGDNSVSDEVIQIHGITQAMLEESGEPYEKVFREFKDFIGRDLIVGFNVNFDLNFLYDGFLALFNEKLTNDFVDVLRIARRFYPNERHNRLADCIVRLDPDHFQTHRSLDDCYDTKRIFDYYRSHDDGSLLVNKLAKGRVHLDLSTLSPNEDEIDEENPFYGRNICFTGKLDNFTRKEAAQAIVNIGGRAQNKVTSTTDYLILGDTAYALHGQGNVTSKLKKAREYLTKGQDLTIITETVFIDMLNDRLNELNNTLSKHNSD